MIEVSEQYKQVMSQPIRNRGYVSVSLGVVNQSAQGSARVTSSVDAFSAGNIFENSRDFVTYATMEEDFMTCDGSMVCMPEENQYLPNGIATMTRIVDVAFDKAYPIKGLTIDFGVLFPTSFKITANGADYTFANSSPIFSTETNFGTISGFKITSLGGLGAQRRLRIRSILMGVGLSFSGDNIEGIELEEFVSHISAEASYSDLRVTVFDTKRVFDVDNEDSFMNYLEPLQPIKVSIGLDLNNDSQEWLQIADLKLKTWSSQNGKVVFSATDKLSHIEDEYENLTLTSRTAKTEIVSILTDCGYQADEYEIDDYLDSVYITAPIQRGTHRDCLQTICNAFRSIFYVDENGILQFKANFSEVVSPSEIVVNASTQAVIANPENTINGTEVKEYAMMGTNMIKANGNTVLLENSASRPTDSGFISSNSSNSSGTFATNPYIELEFTSHFSYYGVYVDFGGCVPQTVVIKTYSGNTLLNTFTHNSGITENAFFEDDLLNFDKLRIEITKTDPYTRALINNIRFSHNTNFRIDRNQMYEEPVGTVEQKVKEVRVKIYTYQLDDDNIPQPVDDSVYLTQTINASGTIKTCENPLIDTQEKAELLLTWLSNYYSSNVSYAVNYRGDPRLQAGDRISLESAYKNNLQVDIEKKKFSFNGAFGGNLELRRAYNMNVGELSTMRRVINSLLYDTDTADAVITLNGASYYKTQNGAFFVTYPNGEMNVVTEEFIREMLGRNNVDKYIEIFGQPQEG